MALTHGAGWHSGHVTPFALHRPPLLSRDATDPLDRIDRTDAAALDAAWPAARVLRVGGRGKVRTDGAHIRLDPAMDVAAARPAGAVLVGGDAGRLVWAVAEPGLDSAPVPGEFDIDVSLGDLRTHGTVFGAVENRWLVTALALLNWHRGAGFCARDGAATVPVNAGWVRVCEECGREEYPRTDPAIICLVHDDADRVLLARQPSWPERRFSVLAGFVEAGESLEACVAREIGEEVGVPVRDVRYLGSQPWPFPRSIMLGFSATADPGAPVRFRDGEIAEARWFTRDEVRDALALGDWAADTAAPLLLPGSISIARGMIESWVDPR